MAKGTFRRVGNTAVPAGKEGREALQAIPDGNVFIADFRTARNVRQHDLFWALCDLCAEATDSHKNAVKEWLLAETGFADPLFLPDGSMKIVARSIAFESMEQMEFNQFFRLAVIKVAELLGSATKEVWQRFEDMLDPETRADTRKRFKRMQSPPTVPDDAHTESEDVT
jgi:hypothetical protein